VTIEALRLLQLLGETVRSDSQESMRLSFAKTMAVLLDAQVVQLMGLDITQTRCVPLGAWPQHLERFVESGERFSDKKHDESNKLEPLTEWVQSKTVLEAVPEFDLSGKIEAERLMLFALKTRRFQMERQGTGGDILLSTLKTAIFGSGQMANFALIPALSPEDKGEISPLVFFALLGRDQIVDERIKLAQNYARYCRDLNAILLDLNMRAGASENLAKSLAKVEEDHKKMRDSLSDMMSHRLVGSSAPMRLLRKNIIRFAPSDAPIFIHGETGTGKELVAREIHRLSKRGAGAFIAINVTALPKGLEESELFGFVKGAFTGADASHKGMFALADGGTLFLDEIGDMSLDLQAKILRVLQEKSFRPIGSNKDMSSDFRLISATHRNLAERVAQGLFREDLFYRLTTFNIETPPLRARLEDLAELCAHFLQQMTDQDPTRCKNLSSDALAALARLPFFGNVRQLHALLLRASYLSDDAHMIKACHIDEAVNHDAKRSRSLSDLAQQNGGLKNALETYEREILLASYRQNGGNRAKMAVALHIPLRTLADKMKKYELERKSDEKANNAKLSPSFIVADSRL